MSFDTMHFPGSWVLHMRVILRVVNGPHTGRKFVFDRHDNFIVGRAKFARFQLSKMDGAISRVHFLVEVNPPRCRLTDMGSTNGTKVNGKRVQSAELHDGDTIAVGEKTVICVSLSAKEVIAPVPPAPPTPATSVFDEATIGPAIHGPQKPLVVPTQLGADSTGTIRITQPSTMTAPSATRTFHRGDPCLSCGLSTQMLATKSDSAANTLLDGICGICLVQADQLPQPIAGYRLVRELGHGGMGVVYLALRETDGDLFAVKTIKPAVAPSRVEIERFLREARILEQLDHPQIVAFRKVDEVNGLLYFAMDFVRGTDGARLLKTAGGPLSIARAVDLTCQMLEGLAYAHARGFVHRDIKPANLLVEIRNDREIGRLTDFGLARTYQSSQMSGLTITGDLGGTLPYMAPEQITHFRETKPPADQYAAAATLYKLLTCHNIYNFPRHSPQQILMILQDEPIPVRSRRPELPDRLAEIIHRALSRAPADRFPDVSALRDALEPFRSPTGGY